MTMGENNFSADRILHLIRTKKADFWERQREKTALSLFHRAAVRVPAYKDFLKKNKVNPNKIKNFKDFQLVPPVDKKNYLRKYPLEKLVWDGSLNKAIVFTSTSGSTGNSLYFPRGEELDINTSIPHELFLENSSHGIKGPTLIIIGFGMGVWIGGLITYKAFEIMSRREKYNLSILTTGINKAEIFRALENLSPNYEQTILCGYPPFIKDILDEGVERGINFKKYNIRLLFAAELFTEKFREYVAEKAGVRNLCLDTINIYGTAELGANAFETPLSILVRRFAIKNNELFKAIFPSVLKTPTLAQYNPFSVTYEAHDGELFLTGNNTIPFIRYAVGDHGGIFEYSDIVSLLKQHGISLLYEAKKAGIEKRLYQLPFVYVYERKDFSTTLYGLQIYPETIKDVLLEDPVHKSVTGKFTMQTKFDRRHNQYLELNIELKKDKKADKKLKKDILMRIITHLRISNSEYRELSDFLKKRAHPKLIFWPNGHRLHFHQGTKQKWVKK